MPLVKRCVCCGRIADTPYDAMPYRKGIACAECYNKWVKPALKWKGDKHNYYDKAKTY